MNFEKTDIQVMLLDSAKRLLGKNCDVEYWRAQRDSDLGFQEKRWEQFAELGWLALPIPEDKGGLGGTIEDAALLNTALGAAIATEPYATMLGAAHILSSAPNQRCEALLEELSAGTTRVGIAHREPGGADLDVRAELTQARHADEGFVLDGAKFMVADAPACEQLIVSAQMDEGGDLALFLVDQSQQGISAENYPLLDGSRASDLVFAQVKLPADALIASGNAAQALIGEATTRMSVANMAQAVGAMEATNAICGEYVKERKQFGVAIGSFQAIQHLLADMVVAAHQARSMLYHAIAQSRADNEEREAAISASRIVVGEAGRLVSRSAIQIHGGYGLTDEYAVSHYFRRLLVLEKSLGDIEAHVERFGDAVFA